MGSAIRFLGPLGSARWSPSRLLPPGVPIDVEHVAVLREAIDECGNASRAWEDLVPLLEGEIRRDDRRLVFVSSADQVVKQIGGAVVLRHITDLVEHEDVGRGIALQTTLGGRE